MKKGGVFTPPFLFPLNLPVIRQVRFLSGVPPNRSGQRYVPNASR